MSTGHLYIFLREVSGQVLCPFLSIGLFVFGVELYEFFIYFGYYPFIGGILCKCHLPFGWLLLFCWWFLSSCRIYIYIYISGFLHFSTMDTWGQEILCCGDCAVHCRVCGSTLVSTHTMLWIPKMIPHRQQRPQWKTTANSKYYVMFVIILMLPDFISVTWNWLCHFKLLYKEPYKRHFK